MFKRYPRLMQALPVTALIAAVLIAYSNVYGNGFVFDDDQLIAANILLRPGHGFLAYFMSSTGSGGGTMTDFYRPLQMLAYSFVVWIWGMTPLGFHLLNTILHVSNTLLVYALGRRLKLRESAAFFAALLWGLHPLHTEAVTYMSGTADLLQVFFILLGLLILLPDFAWRRMALACFMFLLALLCKESAVIFPGLAVITLYLVGERKLKWTIYLCTWPLWMLAIGYTVLHLTLLNFQGSDTTFVTNPHAHAYATHVLYRLMTCFATLPFYLSLLMVPVGLHIERQFPVYTYPLPEVWAGGVLVLLALVQVGCGRARRGLPLSWGLLWFGIALLPDTGILLPVNALFLEHWMYLPTIGLFLGIGETLAGFTDHPRRQVSRHVILGLAVVMASLFGLQTFRQNRVWHDPFTLYPNILSYETSLRAITNLGRAYANEGNFEMAMNQFGQAIRLSDTLPEVHQNIAFILTHTPGWQEHPERAIAELKRALEIDPDFMPAAMGLAYIYRETGNREQEAIFTARTEALKRKLIP